jgi:hypothetical protein
MESNGRKKRCSQLADANRNVRFFKVEESDGEYYLKNTNILTLDHYRICAAM